MNYKQKTQQKLKIPHLISLELIKGKRFKEIVNIVNEGSVLTNRDRYIYGYSLLCQQQYLKALFTLWPLAAKGHTKLQEDCGSIMANIFQDQNFLFKKENLSEKTLYTLFLVAQSLMPQSRIYTTLKQHLFDFLWQKHDYEQLERILKGSKKELSGILVENLSKLMFFQADNKLPSNIAAFIGYVLTGGACLIIRNSIYHNNIADQIRVLANEIKAIFFKLEHKNQPRLAWDKNLFEKFVDYEASILIRVLQLVVGSGVANLDLIPTPSYLITYDITYGRVGQKFLAWLATLNKELLETYQVNTLNAVIWAFSGDKLSTINSILKLAPKNKIHPYLRLAIMLRATNIKKSALNGLVQITDFENLIEPMSLFRDVAIQTAHLIINAEINITPEFWQILLEFDPVLQDPEIRNILIKRSIQVLHVEHKNRKNLNLGVIKSIAHQTNDHRFEEQIDALFNRQQECLQFLLTLNDNKGSKQIIKKIKDQPALNSHLTLIVDSCLLVAAGLSKEFFQHIKTLVTNKAINKLIELEDLFDFNCECYTCKEYLCNYSIPEVVKKLKLSVAAIPEILPYDVNSEQLSSASFPKGSVLSRPDPFIVLDVTFTDSKQIIMQKVMKLIQQQPEKMAIFRQAQSELFDPAQRFLHHYFRYLSYEDHNIGSEECPFLPLVNFPFRDEFLNEN